MGRGDSDRQELGKESMNPMGTNSTGISIYIDVKKGRTEKSLDGFSCCFEGWREGRRVHLGLPELWSSSKSTNPTVHGQTGNGEDPDWEVTKPG